MMGPDPFSPKKIVDGWSTNVTLTTGTGSQLGTQKTAQPAGKIQSMAVNFPFSGDFTIEFDLQIKDFPAPGKAAIYMAEALIQLSVEGNTVKRRLSIANGTTLTGVAQGLKVQIWDTSPTGKSAYLGAVANTIGLAYNVSCQVALGTRAAKNVQPQLTPGPGVLEAGNVGTVTNLSPGSYDFVATTGNAFDIPIPQDAGVNAVLVVGTVSTAGGGDNNPKLGSFAAFFTNSTSGQTSAGWYPLLAPIWVPIPPGMDIVTIQTSVSPPDTDIQCQVFFAIDG